MAVVLNINKRLSKDINIHSLTLSFSLSVQEKEL